MLDASAVVEWLLGAPAAPHVEDYLADPTTTLHAPHLLSIEVAQVLRRLVRRDELDEARAQLALDDLADLDVTRYEHEPLLALIWRLRSSLTAYDAAYVALALALDCPLVTLDAKLAAAPHGAVVELVGGRP